MFSHRSIAPWVYLLGVLLLPAFAEAVERPDWVAAGAKKEDSQYRYYVGRAASLTESDAFAEARRDAQVQAIRENYGTRTQVELRAVESTRSSQTLKSFDEEFPKVSFEGFDQADSYTEPNPKGGLEAWLLMRYSKTTIAREKLRLAKNPASLPADAVSEQGSAAAARAHGKLEVTSEPSGADVFIDEKRYGVTPLKLMGVLEDGRHEITIDHPAFASYTEKVTTGPQADARIHKKLRKALGYLTVTTSPSGAKVRIEGHPAGVSPVNKFPVSAGKNVSVEISGAGLLPLNTEVTVARERHETRFYTLESSAPARTQRGAATDARPEVDTAAGQEAARALLGERTVPTEKEFSDDRSIYTFSIVPASYKGSPLSTIDIPHSVFGVSFAVDITPSWYWELSYRMGQREVQYANALVAGKFHHLSLSTGWQVKLWERHSFSAELTALRLFASYRMRPTTELEFRTAPAMSQWALGGALRYRWLFSAQDMGLLTTGWGVGFRLAGMSYMDAAAFARGKVALEGEMQCFFLF